MDSASTRVSENVEKAEVKKVDWLMESLHNQVHYEQKCESQTASEETNEPWVA